MASDFTLTPTLSLTANTTSEWQPAETIIINNGSTIDLRLGNITYKINGINSDIRIIKAEIFWPDSIVTIHRTSLTNSDIDGWLNKITPKYIVFDELELAKNNEKEILVKIYDAADNSYTFYFSVLIESRSILSMNITVDPVLPVYNGKIAATLLSIQPESIVSKFPKNNTPVLTLLT